MSDAGYDRVSTSPKNGAINGTPVESSGNGVYVLIGALNVTLPLLLTYRKPKWFPKKSMVKGSGTAPVEPSSFGGSDCVSQPARCSIAPARDVAANVSANAHAAKTATNARKCPRLMSVPLSLPRPQLTARGEFVSHSCCDFKTDGGRATFRGRLELVSECPS